MARRRYKGKYDYRGRQIHIQDVFQFLLERENVLLIQFKILQCTQEESQLN